MVVPRLTEFLCGLSHMLMYVWPGVRGVCRGACRQGAPVGRARGVCFVGRAPCSGGRPGMKKGPAGRSRGALLWSAPASGQRRCLGSGAGGLRRWSRPMAVAGGMAPGCACGACGMQGPCPLRDLRGTRAALGLSPHRAGSSWSAQPSGPASDGSAGRPRASPEPTVLLGDRAAVPCRPVTSLERGPTTHSTIRTPHRPSEPRVVLSGPPLAGTDTGTNEAAPVTVTRRTGER
jgi:hypothetical protein